jgi:hypothetical protein
MTRLTPLLEWMSVDQETEDWNAENKWKYKKRLQPPEVRKRLLTFVESFTAEKVAAGDITKKLPSEWPLFIDFSKPSFRAGLSNEEIAAGRVEELRWWLSGLLLESQMLPLSLSFSMDQTQLLVSGPLPHVVLYLAAWYVAEYEIVIAQCEAPMADVPGRHERNWAKWPRCNGLLVAGGRGSGRHYCSDACKQRAKNPNWKKEKR